MKSLKVFLLILFLIGTTYSLASAQSADSTDEAQTESTESADKIQENLRERLQKVNEEKRDRIQGITDNGQVKRRAFFGTIQRISEETITLSTRQSTVILTLNNGVQFIQSGKKIEQTDMEIDNEVVVMGYQDRDEFTPKIIQVYEKSFRPATRQVVVGNISDITASSVTVRPRGSEEEKVYSFTAKDTTFESSAGEEIKIADLDEGLDILMIVKEEDPISKSVKDSVGRIIVLRSLASPVAIE